MTIEDPALIATTIRNNGCFPGDPQYAIIYEYIHTVTEKKLYAVFLEYSHDDMCEAPMVATYRVLWDRQFGTTIYGVEFLKQHPV